ncbi:adenylate/guanylate cyclase domain-containing protein [Aureisphaera galaxeae]|uniref:adenylate/guanylate cyclase domain-containing protein n=1 Tax=Aureisphaera galaxeae TaxID=1538023 RepID=UPI0023501E96|nr:adenylate/guanylate cyclase domain-containing protein [Aureisphaera galaxeae]MDC8003544.1 adenylate/guanylate cyclase domain-containing protein [Aureisphaera galaxeae]
MGFFSNRRVRFYANRAFWILIAWVLIANLIFFYDFISLSNAGALSSDYDFTSAFFANLVVAISAGVIGGLLTVNLMEYWLRKYAFWKALVLIVFIYCATSIVISLIGAAYLASVDFQLPMWNEEVIEEAGFIFGDWRFLKNFIIWLFIVLCTLIVLMINDKYGPGVFRDYLLGRYFQPKRERRIFMFADIKNATGIAETLGEEKYFHLLKDFFKDIGPAIVRTRGEIYQYVGDEVVITWKMKQGLKDANALSCFYIMQSLIAKKADRYMKKYNVVPEFKVGYHFGSVMVGELGQIKRDIAFSGDVLNTAARIQAKCNELGVSILSSEDFSNVLPSLPEGIVREPLGKQKLKGKASEIGLVTFRNEN